MGFRFRKSIKLLPGVRVNFGKKSTSISFGNKFCGITVNSKGTVTKRVSAPGTGISFSERIERDSKK